MQIAILSFFHYFSYMFKKRDSVFEVEEGKYLSPKFDSKGLIPVVTTDNKTGEVLMHGYMNSEALKKLRLIIIANFPVAKPAHKINVNEYPYSTKPRVMPILAKKLDVKAKTP